MRIGAIILGRAKFGRWPGKVLYPIAGKPMIEWVIIKCKKCGFDEVVVSTTDLPEDKAIIEIAERQKVIISFGDKEIRVKRIWTAAIEGEYDAIAFPTACTPFLDQEMTKRVVDGARLNPNNMYWWDGAVGRMSECPGIYRKDLLYRPGMRGEHPEKILDFHALKNIKGWKAYDWFNDEMRNKYLININIAYPFQALIANMVCDHLGHFPENYDEVVKAYMEII